MQTCVIFNPSARGEKAEAVYARMQALFPRASLRRTEDAGHARVLAADAARVGVKTIIAAGGDGTANEVVNGIGDVPDAFENCDFGILPLGTVNVFARELGVPLNLQRAARVLNGGNTRRIDLGCADYSENGSSKRRLFIQLAGAGLDSRAIELVSWQLKKKVGPMAYIVAGLRAVFERQPVITVRSDTEVSGELVLIGNGRFYGGSLAVFPAASLTDGKLDVCVLKKVNWLRVIGAGAGLLTGQITRFCSALHFSHPSVKLTSASRVVLQLDGENVCELPATLSIRPGALRVIVP